jgi:hypothetical protein
MKQGGFPWLGQKPHLSLFASLSMQASQPLDASLLMSATQSAKYFKCLKCLNSYFPVALAPTEQSIEFLRPVLSRLMPSASRYLKRLNSYFSAALTPTKEYENSSRCTFPD